MRIMRPNSIVHKQMYCICSMVRMVHYSNDISKVRILYMQNLVVLAGADLGFIKGGGLTQGTNLLGRGVQSFPACEACWN